MNPVDYPNMTPGVCAICEGVPPVSKFVDTLRHFEPAGLTHLNGRKYICEHCVKDAANALGLIEQAVAPFKDEIESMRTEVATAIERVTQYEAIKEAVDKLVALPEKAVVAVVKKPAAKKPTKAPIPTPEDAAEASSES